ncbi:MAG: ATP-binding protein, partial [Moraxella sp.]
EQLYSIMVNIFNNAVQAGATQLLIQLQTAEQTTIKIIDNGRGIDPEKLAKINQQQPIISGTGWGVGIMLAKTVLDYVGGELTIDPNYHDQQIAGTQVAIQLNPCYHEPQQESE